jgi:DEAD/DEAH box helicase domain-containing protein
MLHHLEKDAAATFLCMFPTKALAQDQQNALQRLISNEFPNVNLATFDGDTPFSDREFIQKSAQIILTNPDMVHISFLPWHSKWKEFFKNLKFIFVDGKISIFDF